MKTALVTVLFLCVIFTKGFAQSPEENDSTKRVKFAAIPIVNYSNTLGGSIGLMTQVFYKVNINDTISPSSSTGLFGMYTTNNTYFAAAFQQFYLNEDKWRIKIAAGIGNINFQFWQDLPISGGTFIDFATKASFGLLRVERKIYKKLYGGLNAVLSFAETEYDLPDNVPDSLRFDKRNMNNLGYLFNFDKREHQLNPYGGFNVTFKNDFYRTWMKSTDNFEKYEITYNHFYQIKNERNILVTRVHASISGGDVPFQGQNVVGQDDIRGYSSGKFRNNQVYAIQAEYRWRFYKKFGMVGFFGVATAIDKMSNISGAELLPGGGVGFRYMMIPKERINVGIDVAKGKDDWGLYFRIGETFGR